MPSLLETIGQQQYDYSQGGGGGVSYYSPTRELARPTGTMANAGTAQQILGGGGGGSRCNRRVSFGEQVHN